MFCRRWQEPGWTLQFVSHFRNRVSSCISTLTQYRKFNTFGFIRVENKPCRFPPGRTSRGLWIICEGSREPSLNDSSIYSGVRRLLPALQPAHPFQICRIEFAFATRFARPLPSSSIPQTRYDRGLYFLFYRVSFPERGRPQLFYSCLVRYFLISNYILTYTVSAFLVHEITCVAGFFFHFLLWSRNNQFRTTAAVVIDIRRPLWFSNGGDMITYLSSVKIVYTFVPRRGNKYNIELISGTTDRSRI